MIRLEDYLLDSKHRPSWLEYPKALVDLVEAGEVHFVPWHILEVEYVVPEVSALAWRYGRKLVPFAYRQNNDDLACFECSFGDQVKIVHNHATKGWEDEASYPNFSEWLKAVEAEMEEWGDTSEGTRIYFPRLSVSSGHRQASVSNRHA